MCVFAVSAKCPSSIAVQIANVTIWPNVCNWMWPWKPLLDTQRVLNYHKHRLYVRIAQRSWWADIYSIVLYTLTVVCITCRLCSSHCGFKSHHLFRRIHNSIFMDVLLTMAIFERAQLVASAALSNIYIYICYRYAHSEGAWRIYSSFKRYYKHEKKVVVSRVETFEFKSYTRALPIYYILFCYSAIVLVEINSNMMHYTIRTHAIVIDVAKHDDDIRENIQCKLFFFFHNKRKCLKNGLYSVELWFGRYSIYNELICPKLKAEIVAGAMRPIQWEIFSPNWQKCGFAYLSLHVCVCVWFHCAHFLVASRWLIIPSFMMSQNHNWDDKFNWLDGKRKQTLSFSKGATLNYHENHDFVAASVILIFGEI